MRRYAPLVLFGACVAVALGRARPVIPSAQSGAASALTAEVGGFSGIADLAPVSATDIHAAGSRLIHSDGETWVADLGTSGHVYKAVSFSAPGYGWAAGPGFAIECRDGAWLEPRSMGDSAVYDLHVLGPDVAWAAGWDSASRLAAIWRLRDGVWRLDPVTGDLPNSFTRIWMASPSEGWAVGGNSIAHFDGISWNTSRHQEWGALRGVAGTGPSDVWVVGGPEPAPFVDPGASRVLHFDGTDWRVAFDQALGGLADIAVREDEGYAVGFEGVVLRLRDGVWSSIGRLIEADRFYRVTSVAFVPGQAYALAALDDGRVYSLEGDRAELVWDRTVFTGIAVASPTLGWALSAGDPLQYDGRNWLAGQPGSPLPGTHDVAVVAADDAWAVGRSGSIQHFDGRSWQSVPSPVPIMLDRVTMHSKDLGWAVGWDVVNTASGPARRTVVLQFDGIGWETIWDREYSSAVWFYDVAGSSPENVWVAWWRGLLHYDGSSWQEYPMESCCTAVGMNNAGEVWAGGGRGIYRYDGDAWQGDLVLPHNFLYINDIDMCTSGEGWAVGQDYLLHFDGSAWRFVTMLPTRSERIATLGGPADQRLWVAGQPRTISSGSRQALLAAPPISPTPPGETAVPFTPMPNDTPTPTRGAPIPEPTRVVTEVQPILLPDLHTGR